MSKEKYMQLAISLALKGRGKVNPNPLVGAVIVKAGNIIGQGHHVEYGASHAEINAIQDATIPCCLGASLYVTLEPCSHHGKTGPCTKAIIKAGFKKVYIASQDPNPLVAGKGIAALKAAGIQVDLGLLEKEAKAINKTFFYYIQNKRPYTTIKYAMTLDGKIASRTNSSKWISSAESRELVQAARKTNMSILVGINTVLHDDPLLNYRGGVGFDPIRIILDSQLRLPLESKIFQTADQIRTIIACSKKNLAGEKAQLLGKKCEIIGLPENPNGLCLITLFNLLGKMQIDSCYVEGGGEVHWSILEAGLAQEIHCYLAPKLIGGKDAKMPIAGLGIAEMKDALFLKEWSIKQVGPDLLVKGRI